MLVLRLPHHTCQHIARQNLGRTKDGWKKAADTTSCMGEPNKGQLFAGLQKILCISKAFSYASGFTANIP
jgi:hypothetical protein